MIGDDKHLFCTFARLEINFEYSGFWLLLLLPLAVGMAWWMYWFVQSGKDQYQGWSKTLRLTVSILRFLAFSILVVLLLKPFIIDLINDEEKPKLLLYIDESKSISDTDKAQVNSIYESISAEFSDAYDIETLPFAGRANRGLDSTSINPLSTNYQEIVSAVNDDFYGQNIGAVMVASDGLITDGLDPRFMEVESGAPIFTIALGDTAIVPDFELVEVLHNRLVYLGNQFQVKARINATRLKEESALVELKLNGTVLDSKRIGIEKAQQSFEVSFLTTASKIGLNQFEIVVTSDFSESNLTNNRSDFFIDVLDSRTQILIIAKTPHPDVSAIKQSIENNDQYEVSTILLKDWDRNVNAADMVILHGIPTDANDLNQIKMIRDEQIPVLAIASSEISPLHFNSMDFGLKIEANRIQMDEVGGWVNPNFNLFSIADDPKLGRFPPMSVIFSDFRFTGESSVALKQRVGSIKSEKPLLVLSANAGWKRGVLIGEGWWRWKLYERMKFPSKPTEYWTDKLVVKLVQYLSLKQKRDRLIIDAPRKSAEGDNIRFKAEYYNQSYELVSAAEINLRVSDSANNTFEYRFKPKSSAYEANLGSLPVGDYQWSAQAEADSEEFTTSGRFTVVMNRAEYARTSADHDFLERWSNSTGGASINPNLSEISSIIKQLDRAQPIIHTTREWINIIDWKWITFLIAILLATEWFLRKYNGSY